MNYVHKVLGVCADKKSVFIFLSLQDEINTHPIIHALHERDITVVVPVSGPKNTLTCALFAKNATLRQGRYGIAEPVHIQAIPKESIDIFFVPGMLFDLAGNRKGRGQGYFDRFLVDIKGKKPVVGLCKRSQLVEHVTMQPWDVAVDFVITD